MSAKNEGPRVGSRTPWGTADYAEELAPGIWVVSTPGHGGVKLSRERHGLLPIPARRTGGWFEEDAQALIVLAAFPEAQRRPLDPVKLDGDLRQWEPKAREALEEARMGIYAKPANEPGASLDRQS